MEEGGTIIERIVRFVMAIEGGEEVEAVISATDAEMLKYARHLQETKAQMVELSRAFREMGISISTTQLQNLPQATHFLTQYGRAMEALPEGMHEVSAGEWAMSEAGREAAVATGLVTESQIQAAGAAETLRASFSDLTAAARALLRIWVSFRILIQTLRVFQDIAQASAELQMEMWRLRATVLGVSQSIEGGMGSWDEWVEIVHRLRQELPYVSTKEIAEGLREIVAIVGPLGLTADQLEQLTALIGQMSLVVGQDFLPYVSQIITAVTGTGRAVASLGIDLRDGSKGLEDYATAAGLVWDELNQQQRTYVRLAYAVSEMAKRTALLAEAEEQEWEQLKEVRAAREDIRAQAPGLIGLQVEWNKVLLETDKILTRLGQNLGNWANNIIGFLGTAGAAINAFMVAFREATTGLIGPSRDFVEIFREEYARQLEALKPPDFGTFREEVEETGEAEKEAAEDTRELEQSLIGLAMAAADTEDVYDDLGDAISRALQQAGDALQNYQNAVRDAAIQLSRRLADIAESLERRLADLEIAYERRRDELIRSFEGRRADIRQDAAEREQDLREDLNKRLRRMEEDHQRDMQELREDYVLDLEEAARSRDAISMRRIQQRYILEKQQREREYQTDRQRTQEDYEEQLEDLREAREEQERELEESLEEQLRELEENYQRQQEEARLNAQRQQEDAREDYQQRLDDLEQNFQDRLTSIIQNLIYEEQEFEGAYGSLRTFLDTWYQGDLQIMQGWLNERLRMLQEAGLIEARPPIEVEWPPRGPRPGTPMAMGGFGLATRPTSMLVGEAGPEYFAAWPAGTRLPSQAIDIRLTIDGTQQGLWSGDFETQVVRVLHGVLREVGL